MNCQKCSNPIPDGAQCCPSCGEQVNSQQVNTGVYAQPQIIQVVAPAPKKKPFYKKWWFILGIIILIIAIIAAVSSGGDDSAVKKESGDPSSSVAEGEADNVYKIGEVCNHNGLKIKYVSAEVWTGYNEYNAPEEGNIIVRYYFEIENTGETDRSISSWDFEAYADGKATEQRYLDDELSLTLSSSRSGSGYVYFEVPEDTKKVENEYEYDWLEDSKVIFVFEIED